MNRFVLASLLAFAVALCTTAVPVASAGAGGITALVGTGVSAVHPTAINNSGQITGSASFSGASGTAFRWTPISANAPTGTFKNLGTFKNYTWSFGSAISSNGAVAGHGSNSGSGAFTHALLWVDGGPAQLVGASSNFIQTEAYGVNNARDVVGLYWDSAQRQLGAFLSRMVNGKRQLFIIGEGTGLSISDTGLILARGTTSASPYFFQLTGPRATGTRTNFPGNVWTQSALNASGQVTGYVPYDISAGDGNTYTVNHPGLYLQTAAYGLPAGWKDLGVPTTPPPSGAWIDGTAIAISSTGIVLGNVYAYDLTGPGPYLSSGETVWVWDATNGMRDLNVLFAGSGWLITAARGVNDAGQIVGSGRLNGGPEQGILIQLP